LLLFFGKVVCSCGHAFCRSESHQCLLFIKPVDGGNTSFSLTKASDDTFDILTDGTFQQGVWHLQKSAFPLYVHGDKFYMDLPKISSASNQQSMFDRFARGHYGWAAFRERLDSLNRKKEAVLSAIKNVKSGRILIKDISTVTMVTEEINTEVVAEAVEATTTTFMLVPVV
jgi:hypothetical protein